MRGGSLSRGRRCEVGKRWELGKGGWWIGGGRLEVAGLLTDYDEIFLPRQSHRPAGLPCLVK